MIKPACTPIIFTGIQKLTLLDYPDKTACTLFTQGCNFACPFCHNPGLIMPCGHEHVQALPEDDIFDFLKSRQGLLDGVCISGGEPLIQEGIFEFAGRIKTMGFLLKIDTNGSNPDALCRLAKSGLVDYVAMDIKNTPGKYPISTGISGYDPAPVLESIKFLLAGNVRYEFRTTLVQEFHEPEDILEIARIISAADKYYIQNFDNSENVLQAGLHPYSPEETQELLTRARAILPNTYFRK